MAVMADAEHERYPAELEHEASLRDGTRVRIRPIRPDDAPRLIAFYARLSEHTAYQRFFTVMRRLPPDWARSLSTVDYRRRLALVAERLGEGEPELVGVGRYETPEGSDTPELAFVVQDSWQGKGLGTILLRDVLRAAGARGFRRFRAYVLADNRRMLGLLARFADALESRTDHGVRMLLLAPRDGAAPVPAGATAEP
jgi:RimJ/RimL family protein N-acetyltransferase